MLYYPGDQNLGMVQLFSLIYRKNTCRQDGRGPELSPEIATLPEAFLRKYISHENMIYPLK